MTRAGKEPAEDLKRAIRRAVELAGLEVHGASMFKSPALDGRIVRVEVSPAGWPIPERWSDRRAGYRIRFLRPAGNAPSVRDHPHFQHTQIHAKTHEVIENLRLEHPATRGFSVSFFPSFAGNASPSFPQSKLAGQAQSSCSGHLGKTHQGDEEERTFHSGQFKGRR